MYSQSLHGDDAEIDHRDTQQPSRYDQENIPLPLRQNTILSGDMEESPRSVGTILKNAKASTTQAPAVTQKIKDNSSQALRSSKESNNFEKGPQDSDDESNYGVETANNHQKVDFYKPKDIMTPRSYTTGEGVVTFREDNTQVKLFERSQDEMDKGFDDEYGTMNSSSKRAYGTMGSQKYVTMGEQGYVSLANQSQSYGTAYTSATNRTNASIEPYKEYESFFQANEDDETMDYNRSIFVAAQKQKQYNRLHNGAGDRRPEKTYEEAHVVYDERSPRVNDRSTRPWLRERDHIDDTISDFYRHRVETSPVQREREAEPGSPKVTATVLSADRYREAHDENYKGVKQYKPQELTNPGLFEHKNLVKAMLQRDGWHDN